jgi:hypothetical protein
MKTQKLRQVTQYFFMLRNAGKSFQGKNGILIATGRGRRARRRDTYPVQNDFRQKNGGNEKGERNSTKLQNIAVEELLVVKNAEEDGGNGL